MFLIPNKVFFTKGVGHHKDELCSFERALRDAGIEKCNLVYVSSILPPNCKIIPRNKGLKKLKAGAITYCVMSRNSSNENKRLISAAIGCAVPSNRDQQGNIDKEQYGYISELHCFGKAPKEVGEHVEDMAAEMLASTLGVEFDTNSSWDEKKEVFKISGKIVSTNNVTQTAYVKNNSYTTVVAAAVFLF